jgi:hypothetical protein
MGIEGPEGADRFALEEEDEEQDGPEQHGEDHHHADDPHVEFVGCYPQQEEADADFEEARGKYIEDFAEEPVLRICVSGSRAIRDLDVAYCECCSRFLRVEILNMSASAVDETSKLTSKISSI